MSFKTTIPNNVSAGVNSSHQLGVLFIYMLLLNDTMMDLINERLLTFRVAETN